ncbi:MAG: Arylsulfatase regulator (Fe-S oxidoreductase) [Nitrospira sp.]|jgi:His-Xaa-Ser system radical SAM maturase HxsB|nr:MAG: Arylsulfatase regulator (Fe-S oxidoreductase) [Nitrospira sp.]
MSAFQELNVYQPTRQTYVVLPLRFTGLNDRQYVVTNLAGEFLTIERATLQSFLRHELPNSDQAYIDLRAQHFLVDDSTAIAPELLALKIRTRYRRLSQFTALHLFVVTLRCEHSCPYCQVSRQSEDRVAFDMPDSVARAALDFCFRSPSPDLKIEFQGGEPLLNFELIKTIVGEAKERNRAAGKRLAFVIATNLALMSREILDFCRAHDILISTSLDGPKALHNANRPRPGGDSYERTIAGIRLVRDQLGRDRVSALMTTTESSLDCVGEIIDEYLAQGFGEIFLRPLSPYGFAIRTKAYRAYSADRWLDFYKKGLDYIIELNRQGVPFLEVYAATILKKMFTSDDPGYVDLTNPAGIGIGAVAYNYDGDVYASDESRMLAEMGDTTFRLGHVLKQSYEDIFGAPQLLEPLDASFAQSVPMCTDCAFEPYCGADPVFHHKTFGDFVGRKPESEFCSRNMTIFRFLIERMQSDVFVKRLFRQWATR